MQSYIAILDRYHLESALFLKSFAQALARQGTRKGIILHGDSEYTERLIQTGMMRQDAAVRATKDLNRRLIGLFADHNVSAIGLHGYQKDMVIHDGNGLRINTDVLDSLPSSPFLVISNLAMRNEEITPEPLSSFAQAFAHATNDSKIVLFSKKVEDELFTDTDIQTMKWVEISDHTRREVLPIEFQSFNNSCLITDTIHFGSWPNLKKAVKIT